MKENVNIGKEMRRNTDLNISKSAVAEYVDRVGLGIELNMQELEKIAISNGRKTIMEDDMVLYFGKKAVSTTHEPDGNNRWF